MAGPPAVTREGASEAGPRRPGADARDDCEQRPGEPPPAPLRVSYEGLAKAARCEREVHAIMGRVTHSLGVTCKHCHLEPDYAADTHNKQVANWMARELVPRLRQREGAREVRCKDCHAGKPKLLGNPRRRDLAIEWMTTHLVEDFETLSGKPPKCKDCHGGDVGSAEFRAKVSLTGPLHLPGPASSNHVPSPPAVPNFGER